jgi:hypothetical protein
MMAQSSEYASQLSYTLQIATIDSLLGFRPSKETSVCFDSAKQNIG